MRTAWPSPPVRGLTFYQVLVLASIVEREAQLDEEKPLIAGVYANRLDPKMWPRGVLEADPTVIYAHDTAELAKLPVADWLQYVFWGPIGGGLADYPLPADGRGLQHLQPQGPSARAAVHADDHVDRRRARTRHRGSATCTSWPRATAAGRSAFAKTFKEHQANIAKYLKK